MGIWGPDSIAVAPERQDDIHVVLNAFRSVRSPLAYVSMPITSGRLFYEVLERHGVRKQEDLPPEVLLNEVIKPNVDQGVALADKIKQKTGLPVVAPSVFEARKKRWGQDEYMFMWLRLIEERVREMHMMGGWEYSNGGSQEFTRAMEMQFFMITPLNGMEFFPKDIDQWKVYLKLHHIKVYSEGGEELRLDQGTLMLAAAILDLHARGFEAPVLADSLHKLVSVGRYYSPEHFGARWREAPPRPDPLYEYDFEAMLKAFGSVRSVLGDSAFC